MATKNKNFTALDTRANTGSQVKKTIDSATGRRGRQTTATPEEQAERMANLSTQGRKGCKSVRLNLAMTPENHQFIMVLSKVTGRTQAKMVNGIIAAYRNEHPELLEKAHEAIASITSGVFANEDLADE